MAIATVTSRLALAVAVAAAVLDAAEARKFVLTTQGAKCPAGYTIPTSSECSEIAAAIGEEFEEVENEEESYGEYGCHHWGAGTEEPYRVEYMQLHEDDSPEDVGCGIPNHDGWCYCAEEGVTGAMEPSREQRGVCPPGFEENADWRDDNGNPCPSPADSADGGHDIDFAWCLAYGYEEFEQEDESFISGKEACAICCLPYPTEGCEEGFVEDKSWEDDAGNGCPGDGHATDIDIHYCRFYGNQLYEQKDGSMKSAKQACAICCDTDAIDMALHKNGASKEVLANCPAGFKEDPDWKDDSGNPCPAIDGSGIDFGWCQLYGHEMFAQEDGSSKSGKQACAVCCQPYPEEGCPADFVEDRDWENDAGKGCPGDGHQSDIDKDFCREFGDVEYAQADGTMKTAKAACSVCCDLTPPLVEDTDFVQVNLGGCPEGFQIPSAGHCKRIAQSIGKHFEEISEDDASEEEYGCHHWGAGTEEEWHVEYMPSHEDHTDETGCSIPEGDGWCYCISSELGGGGDECSVGGLQGHNCVELTPDPNWRDDAGNGCTSDDITPAWCRDFGHEMFEQSDGSMKSAKEACIKCCDIVPLPFDGPFAATHAGEKCPDGYRIPTATECELVAGSFGEDFELIPEDDASDEEYGCHHWGIGTEERYHVEYMPSHEDHTEDTGCGISEGEGWCYCVAEDGLPDQLPSTQSADCGGGLQGNNCDSQDAGLASSWMDDAENGCDAADITAAWCRDFGHEMFEQSDGSMKSGKDACPQCCAVVPLPFDGPFAATHAGEKCPEGYRIPTADECERVAGAFGEDFELIPEDDASDEEYGCHHWEAGSEDAYHVEFMPSLDEHTEDTGCGIEEGSGWCYCVAESGLPDNLPTVYGAGGDDGGDDETELLQGNNCATQAADPSWMDDSGNGCDADVISSAWCRDFGHEMFEQNGESMKSGKEACQQCCAIVPLPFDGPFAATHAGAKCPDGYRHPTQTECARVAHALGEPFELISTDDAHPEEFGCHHWGVGTEDSYHVEFMPELESHTEDTGCGVPEGEGWCYCVLDEGLPVDLITVATLPGESLQGNNCASQVPDPDWVDDSGNGCTSDDITPAWCRDFGHEMFEQSDDSMKSGKEACRQCCGVVPLPFDGPFAAIHAGQSCPEDYRMPSELECARVAAALGEGFESVSGADLMPHEYGCHHWGAGTDDVYHVEYQPLHDEPTSDAGCGYAEGDGWCYCVPTDGLPMIMPSVQPAGGTAQTDNSINSCSADFESDPNWRDDSENGCPGDEADHDIDEAWCRDFGNEMFEQADGSMKSGNQACKICCNVVSFDFDGPYRGTQKGEKCPGGYRIPNAKECEMIAEEVGEQYELISTDDEASAEEYGCHHWGAGTDDKYHVEFMPPHPDHTEDTGCAIEVGEGWCYCIRDAMAKCPSSFKADPNWMDDSGNNCDSPDIDAAWCRDFGHEMFPQIGGGMKSGEQSCAKCCGIVSLTFDSPYRATHAGDMCPGGYRIPTRAECEVIAGDMGEEFEVIEGDEAHPEEFGCHHWGAGTDEPYHVEWMAEHEDHTENTGCAVPEGTGWCYCVANAGLPADMAPKIDGGAPAPETTTPASGANAASGDSDGDSDSDSDSKKHDAQVGIVVAIVVGVVIVVLIVAVAYVMIQRKKIDKETPPVAVGAGFTNPVYDGQEKANPAYQDPQPNVEQGATGGYQDVDGGYLNVQSDDPPEDL